MIPIKHILVFSVILSTCLGQFNTTAAQRLALTRTQFIGGTHYGLLLYQVIPTRDGGYMACGITQDSGTADIPRQPHPIDDSGDVILIKLDSLGNKQWVKTYRRLEPAGAQSVCQTADGGYGVYTGRQTRAGDMAFDRVDANGNYLWSSPAYGSSRQEAGWELISTPDHGFLMTGFSIGADGDIPFNYSMPIVGFQPADWVLIKTDSLGRKKWVTVLGSKKDDSFGGFSAVTDGKDYFVAAGCYTQDHDCADSLRLATGFTGISPYIFKIDAAGNKVWGKTYGVGRVTRMLFDPRDSSIVLTSTGGAGYEFANITGTVDIYLMKVDRNGNFKWGRLYGTADYENAGGVSTNLGPDGGYLISGYGGVSTATFAWVKKVDNVGNPIAEAYFTSKGNNSFVLGAFPRGKGAIVIGMTDAEKFDEGTGRNYKKTDTTWTKYCTNAFVAHFDYWPAGIEKTNTKNALKVYPNPAHQQFSVSLPAGTASGEVRCVDASGRLVYTTATAKGSDQLTVTTTGWAPGAYLITWQGGGSMLSAEIIIR